MSQTLNPPSFYILCGNATYNRGDRFNLAAQTQLLQQTFPKCKITVASYNAELDADWYNNVTIVQRSMFFFSREQIRQICASDMVIWGGGALIADNACRLLIPWWGVQLFFIRFILRKPIMAWAHGTVLETRVGRWCARKIYNWCSIITVRDRGSLEDVLSLNTTTTPHFAADPACMISPSAPRIGKNILQQESVSLHRPLVGITLTFWPFYSNKKDVFPYMLGRKLGLRTSENNTQLQLFLSRMRSIAEHIIAKHHVDVLFLPRYPNTTWEDIPLTKSLIRDSKYHHHMRIIEKDIYSPEEYASIWHHLEFSISTALHDTIISTALDVPCYQFAYERKGVNFYEDLHLTQCMSTWDELLGTEKEFDRILKRVDAYYKTRHNHSAFLQKWKEEYRSRAESNATHLARMLDIQVTPTTVHSHAYKDLQPLVVH